MAGPPQDEEVHVKDFEKVVDNLVTFMTLATRTKRAPVPLALFDGVEAMHSDFVGSDPNQPDGIGFFTDVTLGDLHGRLNYGVLGALIEHEREGFHLQWLRQLDKKECRGLPLATEYVERNVGMVTPDGKFISTNTIVVPSTAKLREDIRDPEFRGPRSEEDMRMLPQWRQVRPVKCSLLGWEKFGIQVTLGLQFTQRYYWRVLLGYQGHPRIGFMTDAAGAHATFRLRDIPEGRQRRAALKHWVTEHWRQDRTDPALERQVRAHLRGASEFTWNGFRCALRPSSYDEVREAAARERRELVRARGEDVRERRHV